MSFNPGSAYDDDTPSAAAGGQSRFARRRPKNKRDGDMNCSDDYSGMNQEQAQAYADHLDEKTDVALDKAVQSIAQTEEVAGDTLNKVHSQGKQLERIDQTLHETDQQLGHTKHILRGMQSIPGAISNYFVPKPSGDTYMSPMEAKRKAAELAGQRVKVGWLSKKGELNPSSKRRYFVLSRDKQLHWYVTSNCVQLKGTLDLSGFEPKKACQLSSKASDAAKGWFQVRNAKSKRWLQADTTKDAQSWVDTILSVLTDELPPLDLPIATEDNLATKQKKQHFQQQFAMPQQRVVYHDDKERERDGKLDDVLKGVRRVHNMADDMNIELDRQNMYIDSIDTRIDTVKSKLDSQTETMKGIK